MKSPWDYASAGTEYAHQVALFMWCNMAASFGLTAANDPLSYSVKGHAQAVFGKSIDVKLEALQWLYANKNAVGRNNAIAGARNVAEGVKAGVPDLFLPIPRQPLHGLYVELKRPDEIGKRKGVVSDEQRKWLNQLESRCYAVRLCFGWEAARDEILEYLGVVNG